MISRQQAERIAQSISVLRPDWLTASLVTLIERDLRTWPLLDIAVGLTYVALDTKPDGSWASRTPGRVREQGPWRHVGTIDPELQTQRDREQQRIQADADARATRLRTIAACTICDHDGWLHTGKLCTHDERSLPGYRSRGAAEARRIFAEVRAATRAEEPTYSAPEERTA